MWTDPKDTEKNVAWCRETHAALKPFQAPMRYVNYLDEEGTTAQAYGPNSARLQQVKAKYDPTNFFHMNQNIKP